MRKPRAAAPRGTSRALSPALAQSIRLVGFDVDGVLTDGGLYVGMVADHPTELKRFHVPDGLGLKMLQRAGIAVVFVSGRASEATAIRARELGVDEVIQDDRARKLSAFERLLAARGLSFDVCAFVGDDLPDLPVLAAVALPIAVANACPEVLAAADIVTKAEGGWGAGREVAELILRARGSWDDLVRGYLAERGATADQPTETR